MPALADRVRETTETTGVGAVNLAGAEVGFQGFVAGAGDGAVVYYCIVGQAGGDAFGEWEVGWGTVTDAAPDTLARTTILGSSNGGAAVNFSAGTKDVFLTAPAASMAFSGAMVTMSADESLANGIQEILDWDVETYDVGGWHAAAPNPSRLTVPAGVDRVRLAYEVRFSPSTGTYWAGLKRDGVSVRTFPGSVDLRNFVADTGVNSVLAVTGVLPVVAGTYFELEVLQQTGGIEDVIHTATSFAIEKVGP